MTNLQHSSCKHLNSIRVEISIAPDQMASKKPADLDLRCVCVCVSGFYKKYIRNQRVNG